MQCLLNCVSDENEIIQQNLVLRLDYKAHASLNGAFLRLQFENNNNLNPADDPHSLSKPVALTIWDHVMSEGISTCSNVCVNRLVTHYC